MSDFVSTEVKSLARRLAVLERARLAAKAPQLSSSSIEDGSIDENDADGNLVSSIGKQVDGTHGAVTLNGPVPPVPSAPVCIGGPGAVTIDWDGGYAGDARRPLDYDFTDALVSSDPAMVGAVRAGSFVTAGSITYTTWEAGTVYVALVTESKPGLRSAMSGLVQVVVEDTVTQANLDAADQRLVDARAELELADTQLDQRLVDTQTYAAELIFEQPDPPDGGIVGKSVWFDGAGNVYKRIEDAA